MISKRAQKKYLHNQPIKAMNTVLKAIFVLFCFVIQSGYAQFLPSLPKLPPTTGNQIYASSAYYSYSEPDAKTTHNGITTGIGYERTQKISSNTFIKANIDYNPGRVEYAGTGTKTGVPQTYWDARILIGTNYQANEETISPYIGVGYRSLYNDNRGPSSTGANGYQRTINYTYIPIGLISRKASASNAIIETRLEYDFLLKGKVQSQLSDLAGYGGITDATDANNTQTSGWGLRLSVSYLKENWGITPYLSYWFIQNSDAVPVSITSNGTTASYTAVEPTNRTNEYGVKVSYGF